MSEIRLKGTAEYGTVEKKIHAIVRSMGEDVTYMFKNWAQANDEIDHIEGPTIIYVLPPSGDLDFNYSQVKDYPESQIAFVASTEFDFEGEENDNIIEQMKRLCIRFIKALNESALFEPIEGRITYRVLYDYLDENVTGIVITPPLREEDGVVICSDDEYRHEEVITPATAILNTNLNIVFPEKEEETNNE